MFKSKAGGSGPAGAVTSADAGAGGYASGGATPVAASAPPTPTVKTETRSRCCCCSVARGFLLALLSLLLLGALGSSVASLAIGPNGGLTRPGAAVVLNGTSLTKAAESVENVGKLFKGSTGEVDLEVRTGYVGWEDKSAASTNSGAQTLRSLGESPAVGSPRSRIVGESFSRFYSLLREDFLIVFFVRWCLLFQEPQESLSFSRSSESLCSLEQREETAEKSSHFFAPPKPKKLKKIKRLRRPRPPAPLGRRGLHRHPLGLLLRVLRVRAGHVRRAVRVSRVCFSS